VRRPVRRRVNGVGACRDGACRVGAGKGVARRVGAGSGSRGADGHRDGQPGEGGEDDEQQHERDADDDAHPGADAGDDDADLGEEDAERGEPDQGRHGDQPRNGQAGATHEKGPHVVDPGGALHLEDAAGEHEQGRLGQAVAEHVEQHGRQGGGADRGSHGHHPHVLDAGVGQHPFEVALADQEGGGHEQGEQAADAEHHPEEVRPDHRVGDGLDAQDGIEGHREQHAAHQARHRRRGLAVRVGQPAVHGGESGLGGETEHGQRATRPDQRRVERQVGAAEHQPGQGRLAGAARGGVDEHDPEQGDGDAHGAEDDVLPGRLQRRPGAVVTDQEGRGDRGGLDRGPHQADVVGQDGEGHRGQEHRDQGVVGAGEPAGRRGGVAQPAPGRHEADRPDDGEHVRGESVRAEQAAAEAGHLPVEYGGDQEQPGEQHGGAGRHRGEAADPAGAAGEAEHGEDGRNGQGGPQGEIHQSCNFLS